MTRLRIEDAGDATLEEDGNAVGDRHRLEDVGRDDEDGRAAAREIFELAVDLELRPDVDATRRLDEDEHVGAAHQPARQQ